MVHRFYTFLLRNQVILALLLLLLAWFLLQNRGILMSLFVSYILMAALLPAVQFLERRGLPRILAAFIPFILACMLIFLIILPLVPFFLGQTQAFFIGLPEYLDQAGKIIGFSINERDVQAFITREFDNIGRNAITLTGKVFGGVFSTLTIIIISFYLLLYYKHFRRTIAHLFHPERHDQVMETIERVDDKLGNWLRGQLTLSFVVGFITWIVLTILGLPYALPLAVLAGLLEIIPTLGPIISAIPAVIVALTISPTMAITVVLIYVVIQLLENNILVPKIMQKAVGLNPIIVILAVAIGANMMGVFGALLAVPFVSFLTVLFQSINSTEKKS